MWRLSRILFPPLVVVCLLYFYSFVSLTYRLSVQADSQEEFTTDLDFTDIEPAPASLRQAQLSRTKTQASNKHVQQGVKTDIIKDIPDEKLSEIVQDEEYPDEPWGGGVGKADTQEGPQGMTPSINARVKDPVLKDPTKPESTSKQTKSRPSQVVKPRLTKIPADKPTKIIPQTSPKPTLPPAKLVHILSYQRSGSSFLGKLFDLNPDAFFIYEPLSMLFTALYGIVEDRAIPNNIFFDHYGNFRNLSAEQSELMTWTIGRVFECRLSDFPVSMLISTYWHRYQDVHMTAGRSYVKCLQNLPNLNYSAGQEGLGTCLEHLREPCPRAYNTLHESSLTSCQSILWHGQQWTTEDSDDLWAQHRNTEFYKYRKNFASYFSCLSQLEAGVRECATVHLDRSCSSSSARVVKTVRAPMEVPARLFSIYSPQLKLIHLLRDPRGVTLSRLRAEWAHGYFERQDPDPRVLADSYCRNAHRDVAERQPLETQQPGNIIEVVYDHFMLNLTRSSIELFKALRMEESLGKIQHVIQVKADVDRKDRWRTWLKVEDIRAIEKACPTFMTKYKLALFVP